MKNQFVPYNIAIRLKELGFDEPCIFAYDRVSMICTMSESPFNPLNYNSSSGAGYVSAPLWQQVTAWLRDAKKVNLFVGFRLNTKKWDAHCYDMNLNGTEYVKFRTMEVFRAQPLFDTYEKAMEDAIIDYINHKND